MIRSFPPHPNPLPPGERVGHSSPQQSWGGILAYFDKYRQSFVDIYSLSAYASSGTSPGGGGPFGAIFLGSRNLQVAFSADMNRAANSQAKACGYHLCVLRYRQSFVDVDSLRLANDVFDVNNI